MHAAPARAFIVGNRTPNTAAQGRYTPQTGRFIGAEVADLLAAERLDSPKNLLIIRADFRNPKIALEPPRDFLTPLI
jgi:hypothetical protein